MARDDTHDATGEAPAATPGGSSGTGPDDPTFGSSGTGPDDPSAAAPEPEPAAEPAAAAPTAQRRRRPRLKVGAARGASDAKEDAKSRRQMRQSIVLLLVITLVYVAYLFVTGEIDSFVASMRGVSLKWLAAGIVCFLCYYLFGVLVYAASVVRDPTSPVGIRDLISVLSSGVFFMRLSPAGMGTSPAQIYRLTRAGMQVGEASALSFVRSTVYEACEGLVPLVLLIFTWDFYDQTVGISTWLMVVMFGFKALQVGAMFVVCLFPKPVTFLGNWALGLAHGWGWIDDGRFAEWSDVVNTQVALFAAGFRAACTNVGDLLLTVALTVCQLVCMYALPWFLVRSFGMTCDFVTCLSAAAMLELIVNCNPLPSGAGGVEVGFPYLFATMFGEHLSAGFVLWRAIEYMLPVVIAGPCMGLRSKGTESLNARCRRLVRRVRGAGQAVARVGRGAARQVVRVVGGAAGVPAASVSWRGEARAVGAPAGKKGAGGKKGAVGSAGDASAGPADGTGEPVSAGGTAPAKRAAAKKSAPRATVGGTGAAKKPGRTAQDGVTVRVRPGRGGRVVVSGGGTAGSAAGAGADGALGSGVEARIAAGKAAAARRAQGEPPADDQA